MNLNIFNKGNASPHLITCKPLLIMKLLTVLIFASAIQVTAGSYAQKINLTRHNATLGDVLNAIHLQTGYLFLYDNRAIEKLNGIDVDIREATLQQALDQCIARYSLGYLLENRTILVFPREESRKFLKPARVIEGTVTDAEGNALSGVTVRIKNSNIGTITGRNGRFRIEVADGKTILQFSFLGYQSKEVTVGDQVQITVELEATTSSLNQLVVVGYNVQKKSSFTGSLSTLQPEAYQNAPHESIIQDIQGNIPGVQTMNPSGQPGTSGNTRIRGIGSINASQTPLYIVDGVPIVTSDGSGYGSNPLAGINPNDVASLTVLKDAAATSIYGSRAANGVIIITTKQGKAGKLNIRASMQQGFNKITLPKKDLPLNTTEMIELLREGWVNAGKDPADFVPELEDNDIDTTRNTDWIDALTRLGHFSQYNLSASGGSEKTQFFASGGYYKSYGALKGVDFKRGTARISLKSQASRRLSFNVGLNGYYQITHAVGDEGGYANPVRAIYRLQPWLPIYNDDGSYDFSYNSTHNPVATVKEVKREGKSYQIAGHVGAKLMIIPHLTFETKAAGEITYGEGDRFYTPEFGDGRNVGGRGSVETNIYTNWITTNILRYKHTFGGSHQVEAFAGYEAQKINHTGSYAEAINFLPNLETLVAASSPQDATSTSTSHSLVGTFVNANYNYKQRYFISGSFRRDGASRFGMKKRFANFWSVGLGWSLKETLLRQAGFVTELKLRGSYGINGNQGISNFASRGLYASGNNYDTDPGYIFSQFENPLLTWEQNKPLDVGLDFSLFRNRLSGSVDYYQRTTSSLLLDIPISATNGLTSYTTNIGSMKNQGWEIALNSRNVIPSRENGFGWTTSFNISTLKNRVTKLPSPIASSTYMHAVGYDYYTFYMPGYAGVDPQTGEALWYSSADKSSTTNDFGDAVRVFDGSALPRFYGGLTNKLTYKHFGLSFLLYYNWGNKIYDIWASYTNSDGSAGFSSTGKISRYTYDHRWQHAGDKTDVPKVVFKGKQSGRSSQRSTRFIYDGSYIRLRDITLSYAFPDLITDHLKINSASIFFRASNLFTYVYDKRLTFDPEVSIAGTLDQRPPVYKTLTLGIEVNF